MSTATSPTGDLNDINSMEQYYGQFLFILGVFIPLLVLCFLRWVCRSRQARRTAASNPEGQGTPAPAPTYQEILPRTMSYYDPPNGEPPPTYDSIQGLPDTQTLTYIDEHGNTKEVKWDGGGSPPRHIIGRYNPAFQVGEESERDSSVVESMDSLSAQTHPVENDTLEQDSQDPDGTSSDGTRVLSDEPPAGANTGPQVQDTEFHDVADDTSTMRDTHEDSVGDNDSNVDDVADDTMRDTHGDSVGDNDSNVDDVSAEHSAITTQSSMEVLDGDNMNVNVDERNELRDSHVIDDMNVSQGITDDNTDI